MSRSRFLNQCSSSGVVRSGDKDDFYLVVELTLIPLALECITALLQFHLQTRMKLRDGSLRTRVWRASIGE